MYVAEYNERSCQSVTSRIGDDHRLCAILMESLSLNGSLEAKRSHIIRLLPVSLSEKCTDRNTFSVFRRGEGKNGARAEDSDT
ncbi:hypothetical protein TNCV_4131611 [Trichonephila clavipes]|nr:hypothetical protein TNCV_4131611 [Trichonephila clavipes]